MARLWINNGYLVVTRTLSGPGGAEYELELEYQVFDETGSPTEIEYRGEGSVEWDTGRIVIGDPHRATRLHEGTVSRDPTSESRDYFRGFSQGLKDRRQAAPWKPTKDTAAQSQRFWDGYSRAWEEKRQRLSPNESMEPNAKRASSEWALTDAVMQRGGSAGHAYLYTQGRKAKWCDERGNQIGPQHSALGPALAYAEARGWRDTQPVHFQRPRSTSRDVHQVVMGLFAAGRTHLEGSDKVFISDVLKELPDLTKEALVKMHQRGEIRLASADLVAAVHDRGFARELAESETRHLNSRFQLVELPPYTPNAGDHYVWVVERSGKPLDEEGPYGPYQVKSAKTFARIAAREGGHDRVVTKGYDPKASSFEIVRRYRAGTGERLL